MAEGFGALRTNNTNQRLQHSESCQRDTRCHRVELFREVFEIAHAVIEQVREGTVLNMRSFLHLQGIRCRARAIHATEQRLAGSRATPPL